MSSFIQMQLGWQIVSQVLTILGGTAVILTALFTWIGGVVGKRIIENVKQANAKEIEELKGQITKLQKEHEIAFSSVYHKQADIISTLYGHILNCKDTLDSWSDVWLHIEFADLKPEAVDEVMTGTQKIASMLREEHEKLSQYYRPHSLYFSKSTIKNISKLESCIKVALNNFVNATDLRSDERKRTDAMERTQELAENMQVTLDQLEDEFRQILRIPAS